jgi:hypothetical protein
MRITTPAILSLAICVDHAQGNNGVFEGDNRKLSDDLPPGKYNTGRGKETDEQRSDRLAAVVPTADPFEAPEPNLGPFDQLNGPFRDPLVKAKCFNHAYAPVQPDATAAKALYDDYVKLFDWGFANTMGPPLQAHSLKGNRITSNRFPSMFLRMCFHDNSINASFPVFNQYVTDHINPKNGKWTGPYRFLETSGADASILICPEERYHPNQNFDLTASRILYALQTDDIGITDANGATSMVDKHGLSYSDLLQSGGVAAAIYLTEVTVNDWSKVFKHGRHDACHIPNGRVDFDNAQETYGIHAIHRLCGPTQQLPGVFDEAEELSNWFSARGMNECTWLALLWTHTVMVSSLVDPFFLLRQLNLSLLVTPFCIPRTIWRLLVL